MKFRLDDRGSGFSVLGTDKTLLGGADLPGGRSGGQSGGLYLDQYLGSEFHFIGSALQTQSRLPQADGTQLAQRGTSTSAELDWNTRNWSAWYTTQATSPDLVLLSGFTDLQGYRRQNAGLFWKETWNTGALAQTNATLRWRDLHWWNGDPLDRAVGLDAYLESAGRLSFFFNWDAAGRTWGNDHARSVAARSLTLGGNYKRFSPLQVAWNTTYARTIDLGSGDPAQLQTRYLSLYGTVGSVSYNLSAQQSGLDRERDDQRLVRARELTASGSWQLPRFFYVKTQAFVVRYDGLEAEGVDKFLKAFVGWQPNAFTNAYIGWSGQRHRDPLAILPTERMVERGLFAKLGYAYQF